MRHKETPWTPERCENLRTLYGEIPTAQLGEMFGISKNAVIGKARRMGLCRKHDVKTVYKGLVGADAVAEMMADGFNVVADWHKLGFKGPHYASAWRDKVIESMGAQAQ